MSQSLEQQFSEWCKLLKISVLKSRKKDKNNKKTKPPQGVPQSNSPKLCGLIRQVRTSNLLHLHQDTTPFLIFWVTTQGSTNILIIFELLHKLHNVALLLSILRRDLSTIIECICEFVFFYFYYLSNYILFSIRIPLHDLERVLIESVLFYFFDVECFSM